MSQAPIPILVDDTLATAVYSYPFKAGWVDASGVELVERLPTRLVRERRAVGLLDSVAAQTLLTTHVIVRDVAIAARRASFVSLATHARPDTVDNVTIAHPGVSPATLALAQIVIPAFYGITISGWTNDDLPVSDRVAVVAEGARALIALDPTDEGPDDDAPEPIEGIYQEDLGRAWHLLTNTPFVSHVCIVPREALATQPAAVADAVDRLRAARDVAKARGRELRRDLARAFGVEREVLTETLADQVYELGDEELHGLIELWTRSGLVAKNVNLRSSLVRIGAEPKER
jgi:predicted solute-binding protein